MPQENKPLRRYGNGPFFQEVTQGHLNETQNAVDNLRRDYANNNEIPGDEGGKDGVYRLAVITDRGPNDEADFTGNTYWIRSLRVADVKQTASGKEQIFVKDANGIPLSKQTAPGIRLWTAAVNLAEDPNSHTLGTADTVIIQLYRLAGSGPASTGPYVFWANQSMALLQLLPGQIGVFGAILPPPHGPDFDVFHGGEANPLPEGGYRAIILQDSSGFPPPFSDENDPTPQDPTQDFSFNAVYYNLDESGDILERLNYALPGQVSISDGKWLSNNVGRGIIVPDGGLVPNSDFGNDKFEINSESTRVVGFRVGTTAGGRGIYVGTGGRASTDCQTLDDSVLGRRWLRGGVFKGPSQAEGDLGALADQFVGCAGVRVDLLSDSGDPDHPNKIRLSFDASGKLFRAENLGEAY